MDRIRTLLLARTHTVVLDPDRVANAGTRPTRDVDLDKFEDDLAQLGFVMSLDLAMMIRRLPFQAIEELRGWIIDTLAKQLGARRPLVPLSRVLPSATPGDPTSLYLRRILSWLVTMPEQPCPWCGQLKPVGALDPCGHLVCHTCWSSGNFGGCPICHRRIAVGDPFAKLGEGARVEHHAGTLGLLHLAFDLVGTARERFARLLARTAPLSPADRAEIEAVIDAVGPKAVTWLPARIPATETAAIVVARLWLVAADRVQMVKATANHVGTAADVLRVAVVLMGGDPVLVHPTRLASISRGLRRAILAALDRLPLEQVALDVGRHTRLWKRIGERLHPYEEVATYPNAALAFAIVRGTDLATASFGPALRAAAAKLPCLRVVDDIVRPIAWGAAVEDALRARNPRSALGRLMHRPSELLRRTDHLLRLAQDFQLDGLETILKGIKIATARGTPELLLVLAAHLTRRGGEWPRRVFFPAGDVLRAWTMPDRRALLRADAIGAIVGGIRFELAGRALIRRHYPRAVIDRALADLLIPMTRAIDRSPTKLAWPRGSELAIPKARTLRLFLHWEEPPGQRVDLDLAVAFFDHQWRHVATCDVDNLVVGGDRRAAVHSGDLTTAPPPLGASEFVDLEVEALRMVSARYAVVVVVNDTAVPFDRLPHGFVGLTVAPSPGVALDPRAVVQRFDLHGRSAIAVPLSIDLAEHRLRWMDVHIRERARLHQAGGYRATLAHLGRDFADLVGTHARPTMWDLACIHAAARANLVYVRERDGSFTTYRRRDNEPAVMRLSRLLSGGNEEGKVTAVPVADAPTWFALMTVGDLALPPGSAGYVLDGRNLGTEITRHTAVDLVAELGSKQP